MEQNEEVERLNQQLAELRRQHQRETILHNQLRDYISALERKLTYRETLAILEAKKNRWPWAESRADHNQRMSKLLDPR